MSLSASDFLNKVKRGYRKDTLFSKVLVEKEKYSLFQYRDGYLYTENRGGQEVLCIPRVVTKDCSLTATVNEQAHTILGHYGAQKTANYIRRWYSWPKLGHEVDKYCTTCGICQVSKTSTQRPRRSIAYFADPEQAVGIDRNGLYWSIPQIEGIQLFMGSNMQVNLYGSPGTCKYDD